MHRYNFFIAIKVVERLRKLAKRQGVTLSDVVREALDKHLASAK